MSPQRTNRTSRLASAVFMILALLWLTISAPIILRTQQQLAQKYQVEQSNFPEAEEDANNPFGNTTEEKAPTGNTFSEDYLHHPQHQVSFFTERLSHFGTRNDGTYIAYHGELLVPPPNQC